MSLTTSFDLLWLHSPPCSILVGMRHLSGPNFIIKILTSPPPISSWVHTRMSPIFTFRMDCYAIWAISVFLQVSVQRWFGRVTTIELQDILVWRKLWPFSRNIFIGKNFDMTVDDDFCQEYLFGKALQGFPSFCEKSCEKIVLSPTKWLLHIQGKMSLDILSFKKFFI